MAITYSNQFCFGNTGLPPDTLGHNAVWPEGVARDGGDYIYEVRGWDEAHDDFPKRDPANGKFVWNSLQCLSGHEQHAIAVEQDSSFAYTTGSSGQTISDVTQMRARIFRFSLAGGLNPDQRRLDFSTAGYAITVYDYGQIPSRPDPADQEPLHSIGIEGGSLWVSDTYGNRIIKYDKISGVQQNQVTGLPGARGLCVDGSGQVWVGHSTNKVSCYSNGTLVGSATTLTGMGQIVALSAVGSVMAVASKTEVRTYTMSAGTLTTQLSQYGQPWRAGDSAANRIREIWGMVQLISGGIVITERMGNYGRIQRFGTAPNWVQLALEFTSNASFAKENPSVWVSSDRNIYNVPASATDATWSFMGNGQTEIFPTLATQPAYMGHFTQTHHGAPRLLKHGANYFFYYAGGISIGIYKLVTQTDPACPKLQIASILGSGSCAPDGTNKEPIWQDANKYTWQWVDPVGDGVIRSGDVTTIYQPGQDILNYWYQESATVDDDATIWCRSTVWTPTGQERMNKIVLEGLNPIGNPIYRIQNRVVVLEAAAVKAFIGLAGNCEFQVASRANGNVYSLIKAPGVAPDPGGQWMGGNYIICFTPTGTLLWYKKLTYVAISIAAIDNNGGFVTGTNDAPYGPGSVFHFDRDGNQLSQLPFNTLYGDVYPRYRSGGLDSHMSLSTMRDPRDNQVKVLAADNMNQRIIVYSINDGATAAVGTLTAHLFWDAPSPAPASYSVYKGTTKLTTVSAPKATIPGLTEGDVLTVKSVDSAGVESISSNTITVTKPSAPPVKFRVGTVTF